VKPRWLNFLLAAGLAGNAVEVAVPMWNHYRWLHARRPEYRGVPSAPARRYLKVVAQPWQWQMDSLRFEHDRLDRQRELLTYYQPPDTVRMAVLLDSMTALSREMYRTAYRSCRDLQKSDDAKLRRRMEKRWREQMGL
jgi:hypothetical protein